MRNKIKTFVIALLVSGVAFGGGVERAMDLEQFGEIERSIPEFSELEYYGSQVGMYFGYKDQVASINESLDARSEQLDKLYNFRNLLIDSNLVPPVVVKAKDLYEKLDHDSYHETSTIYRIRKTSRLSYNSPTWREYIYLDSEKLSKPMLPKDMRPKKKEAKEAWELAVREGYERGRQHANDVFELMLSELNEDFNGMVLAHHLYELNMLDFSSVEKLNKGTFVTDREINVNDRVVRLNPNDVFIKKDAWKPHLKIHK